MGPQHNTNTTPSFVVVGVDKNNQRSTVAIRCSVSPDLVFPIP